MNKNMKVIDNSEQLEKSIKKVWSRNVFFMWWYALYFATTVIRASFNRICQIPRVMHNICYNDNKPYVRKISKHKWLEDWNTWVDANYWNVVVMFLFFFCMAVSKTLYHLGKIAFFLWLHIIKPILWMLVALFAAKSISQSLTKKAI